MGSVRSKKVKVFVEGRESYGYLYEDGRFEKLKVRHGNLVYEYLRKTIVFRVPRDLEDKAFLIVPLDKDLLNLGQLILIVKM